MLQTRSQIDLGAREGRTRLLSVEFSYKGYVGIATLKPLFQLFGADKLCLKQKKLFILCVALVVSSDYDRGISATSLNV